MCFAVVGNPGRNRGDAGNLLWVNVTIFVNPVGGFRFRVRLRARTRSALIPPQTGYSALRNMDNTRPKWET